MAASSVNRLSTGDKLITRLLLKWCERWIRPKNSPHMMLCHLYIADVRHASKGDWKVKVKSHQNMDID
ncbi:unnamed protein product [Calypogeia fissa]